MTTGAKKRQADRLPSTPELDEVGKLVEQRKELDAAMKEAVAVARTAGSSWSQIGLQLEMSKKAVQRKYGHSETDD